VNVERPAHRLRVRVIRSQERHRVGGIPVPCGLALAIATAGAVVPPTEPGRSHFLRGAAGDRCLKQLAVGQGVEPNELTVGRKIGRFEVAVAREYFRPDRLNLALVSPLKSDKGLANLLAGI